MSLRISMITLAVIAGLVGTAHADMLASGPVFAATGSVDNEFSCRIFNAGSTTATISKRQIRSDNNFLIPNGNDSCDVPLKPLKHCRFGAAISVSVAYSCRIVATGKNLKLRGTADVRTSTGEILDSQPML